MKKYLVFALIGLAAAVWCFRSAVISASGDENPTHYSSFVSPNIVISQFQAGGGTADDEFIELHNIGAAPVDLNGLRLVYRSASGTSDVGPLAVWSTSTIVQPGQYYLIATTAYDGGVTPDYVYNTGVCQCSLSATSGGLAVRQGGQNSGVILDSVGWGSATNAFVEGTPATAAGNNNSKARLQSGCQDTDANQTDFQTLTPSAPRNTSTTAVACNGGGTSVLAALNGEPTSIYPGGQTLLTMTVLPATNPPSTGLTVTGNLSQIGGSANQAFFDDGTNGDTTAGDNIFSVAATVPVQAAGGYFTVSATASDAQLRTVNKSLTITVNAPIADSDPLLLGNPTGATNDIVNENNYLMPKPAYTLSYNRSKATPNWVAWKLDSSWIGSTPRQDDYRPDQVLPAGWYQVLSEDYSSSGYDRGHMCPSGDRTISIPVNSSTFLMTNFVPQLAANNQGPWEDLESYCRTLASQGNELYIFDGPYGDQGTIAGGRITVPQYTWKVVLVLPSGQNDLQRIWKGTRAFGVIVPNFAPVDINAPWRNFRVTVNQVENLTGYDFFNKVPKNTQEIIERRRDIQ